MLQWIKDYIASPTHQWWVENVWRPSWTKITTFIYGIPAMVAALATQLASWGQDSSIAGYLDKMHVPNWVPVAFATVALVHYVASGRK